MALRVRALRLSAKPKKGVFRRSAKPKKNVAHMLATIESDGYVAPDAHIVSTYSRVLAKAVRVTGLSEIEVADITVVIQRLIRKDGGSASLLELIAGGTMLVAEGEGMITYKEALGAVYTLMAE